MARSERKQTERAVVLQRIDPEQREAYLDAHEDVPNAVTDAMERNNVREFRLFIRDDIAVFVLEAPDVDAYYQDAMSDPDVQEWERYVAKFKQDGIDVDATDDDQVPFMNDVWSLAEGRIQ